MEQERIILVHGTGASEPGPPGNEKWWQPASAFALKLLTELDARQDRADREQKAFTLEPFVWSGANSELDRRAAGQALAHRLLELESVGVSYHLMGHSHGGSVIWHALTTVFRKVDKPQFLSTWTTVGTPFLSFGNRGTLYLALFFLMAVVGCSLLYFLLGDLPGIYLPEFRRVLRDAPPLAIIGVVLGSAASAALALYSVSGLVLQLWRRAAGRFRSISDADLLLLGERWLPITHDQDEPASGLKASVIHRPDEFIPRMGRGFLVQPAVEVKGDAAASPMVSRDRRERPFPLALKLVPLAFSRIQLAFSRLTGLVVGVLVAPIYNGIFAPLLDQFLWETVKRVLQGNDVPGEYLLKCSTIPPGLDRFWRSTQADFQNRLTEMADAAAVGTAKSFRTHLSAFAQGTVGAKALGQAISWREVIHTSYFEGEAGAAALIAPFMLHHTGKSIAAEMDTSSPDKVATPEVGSSPRPYRPRFLYLALATAVSGFCAIASISTVAAERAWLWPYTNQRYIAEIYDGLIEAGPSSLRILPRLDDVLMRWVLLDQTERAISTTAQLDDLMRYMGRNARLETLQRIAYAIGLKGSIGDLDTLLGQVKCAGDQTAGSCLENLTSDQVQAYLLVHAFSGARAAESAIEEVVAKRIDDLMKRTDHDEFVDGYIVEILLESGAFELADSIAVTDEGFCQGASKWAADFAGPLENARISTRLRSCLAAEIENFERQATLVEQNYFAVAADSFRDLVKSLPQDIRLHCQAELGLTALAMNRCLYDRRNIVAGGNSAPLELQDKSAPEQLEELSRFGYAFSSVETPACIGDLDTRLWELRACILPARKAEDPPMPIDASPAEDQMSWWRDRLGNAATATAGEQPAICDDTVWPELGRQMRGIAGRLSEVTAAQEAELSVLAESRTNYELSRRSQDKNGAGETIRLVTDSCGPATLALVWLRLGDQDRSGQLIDIVLSDTGRSQEGASLDFYLGFADTASTYSRSLAKTFLDRSFALVDASDPSVFFQTSDGSAAEGFVYHKDDISRLYAAIEEYRLAALANQRIDRFSDDTVASYLNILDAEIRRSAKYDAKVLNALASSKRPRGYRAY